MTTVFPDYSVMFWLSAICAVILIGIAKAGFGAGVGVMATPLMALTIPVVDAVALLLPLLIVSDIVALATYRLNFDKRNISLLLPGAVLGVLAGGIFFGYFMERERTLQLCIGILSMAFVLFQVGREYIIGSIKKRHPHSVEGVFMGALSGFTSTLAHAGDPPVAIYLIPQQLAPVKFVGTTVVFFAFTNFIKLIPYGALGLLKVGNLMTIVILAPLCYVGVKLGAYLNKHFSETWFKRIIYTALLFTGVQLIVGKNLITILLN